MNFHCTLVLLPHFFHHIIVFYPSYAHIFLLVVSRAFRNDNHVRCSAVVSSFFSASSVAICHQQITQNLFDFETTHDTGRQEDVLLFLPWSFANSGLRFLSIACIDTFKYWNLCRTKQKRDQLLCKSRGSSSMSRFQFVFLIHISSTSRAVYFLHYALRRSYRKKSHFPFFALDRYNIDGIRCQKSI